MEKNHFRFRYPSCPLNINVNNIAGIFLKEKTLFEHADPSVFPIPVRAASHLVAGMRVGELLEGGDLCDQRRRRATRRFGRHPLPAGPAPRPHRDRVRLRQAADHQPSVQRGPNIVPDGAVPPRHLRVRDSRQQGRRLRACAQVLRGLLRVTGNEGSNRAL